MLHYLIFVATTAAVIATVATAAIAVVGMAFQYWFPKYRVCTRCASQFKPSRRERVNRILGGSELFPLCPDCMDTELLLARNRDFPDGKTVTIPANNPHSCCKRSENGKRLWVQMTRRDPTGNTLICHHCGFVVSASEEFPYTNAAEAHNRKRGEKNADNNGTSTPLKQRLGCVLFFLIVLLTGLTGCEQAGAGDGAKIPPMLDIGPTNSLEQDLPEGGVFTNFSTNFFAEPSPRKAYPFLVVLNQSTVTNYAQKINPDWEKAMSDGRVLNLYLKYIADRSQPIVSTNYTVGILSDDGKEIPIITVGPGYGVTYLP